MSKVKNMLSNRAGRAGLVIGITCGFAATALGAGSTALLFVGMVRFLANRFGR